MGINQFFKCYQETPSFISIIVEIKLHICQAFTNPYFMFAIKVKR